MSNEEAIKLVDDRMCFGRGEWSEHHQPVIDDYWQAGDMAIKALKENQNSKAALNRVPSEQSEIIRCKDCKFYSAYDYTGKLMCKRIGKGMILPKPEDFCSYAERITDKNDKSESN